MKTRFSTVLILMLNMCLTLIGLFVFGPLQVFVPAAFFIGWLCVWAKEVRS